MALPPRLDAAYPGLEGCGPHPGRETAFAPAWPCSRRGLPGRDGYPSRRWALTPPFHPCPRRRVRVGRWRFVSVALSEGLPPPGGYPAPCPMECGLSSTAIGCRDHPADPGSSMLILRRFGAVVNSPIATESIAFFVFFAQSVLIFLRNLWFLLVKAEQRRVG